MMVINYTKYLIPGSIVIAVIVIVYILSGPRKIKAQAKLVKQESKANARELRATRRTFRVVARQNRKDCRQQCRGYFLNFKKKRACMQRCHDSNKLITSQLLAA